MGRTTTVILAVGVVGLLIWLLTRDKKVQNQNQGVSFSLDVGKAISGIAGLFGGNGKAAPAGYVTSTDTAAQASYALSHDVVEQQGNQLIDLNTGNALVFGPT